MRLNLIKRRYRNTSNGFTLVEMIVATAVFATTIIIIIGIMGSMLRIKSKFDDIQAVQDSIRFSLELITKEIRFGENFSLVATDCGSGVQNSELYFRTFNNVTGIVEQRVYFLGSTGAIMRVREPSQLGAINCGEALPFTGTNVIVDNLRFIPRGNTIGPLDGQPVITIAISIRSNNDRLIGESTMDIQTTVTQRLRDIAGTALPPVVVVPPPTPPPPLQCSDGIDNDFDGFCDTPGALCPVGITPGDPGCDNASDNNEIDTATTPQCSDGADNDGDALVDYPADPGCVGPTDDNEFDAPPPVISNISCFVSPSCPETTILRLSDNIDAHAGTPSSAIYTREVCCSASGDSLSNSCVAPDVVMLRLSGVTDAHAEQNDQSNYSEDICISAGAGTVACTYRASCLANEECIVTISDVTDAHVADCTTDPFPIQVCCEVQ